MAADRRPQPARTTGQRPTAAAKATARQLRPGTRSAGGTKPVRRPRPAGPARTKPVKKSRKRPVRLPLRHAPQRLRVVLVAMAIALSLCGGRLLQLQGFDSSAYAATSAVQLTRTLPLLPSRGEITDRNGLVMASTAAAVAVTADPQLTAPYAAEIATVLDRYLDVDPTKMISLLTKPETRFVYLVKKVPA